jgi:flagellar biosynthesis/type III secretory pathway chaperone
MDPRLSPDIEAALEDLLLRETDELGQFISLLEEELDALAVGQADDVRDCSNRKQLLLGRIFATRDAVNTVARRASANPQLKTAEAWLARSSSARVRHAFHRLTDRAEEARELNQLANRLIQIKLRGVNQRLDVLQPDGRMEVMYYPEGYSAGQMSAKGMIGSA